MYRTTRWIKQVNGTNDAYGTIELAVGILMNVDELDRRQWVFYAWKSHFLRHDVLSIELETESHHVDGTFFVFRSSGR